MCRRIYDAMNAVLKEEQDQRINTGANRKATWTASAPGGRSTEQISSLAGNSANAELAAGQRAVNVSEISSCTLNALFLIFDFRKVVSRCANAFSQFSVPQSQQLGDGLVG